jgi:hypothetical protein
VVDECGVVTDQLVQLLQRELSKDELHALAASCSTMPADEKDRSEFAATLLDAMLTVFVYSGDHEGLLTLLSVRFPARGCYGSVTEDTLLYWGQKFSGPLPKFGDPRLNAVGHKFADAILILTDAYEKAKDMKVRRDIAVAVRHAFTGVGVVGKKDEEFVANAVKWYRGHRDRLKYNLQYKFNEVGPGAPNGYETNPLFLLKSSAGPYDLAPTGIARTHD